MFDVTVDLADAKTDIVAAGVLVLGVFVVIKLIHWIELVLIQREANRDFLGRYH